MANNQEPMDYETDPSEYEEEEVESSEMKPSEIEIEPTEEGGEDVEASSEEESETTPSSAPNSLLQSVSEPEPFSSSEEDSETEFDSGSEESVLTEIRPRMIDFSPEKKIDFSLWKKPFGGSVEDMLITMGDRKFAEGEHAEEWKRLKLEEVESYTRILEVQCKQAKFARYIMKSL